MINEIERNDNGQFAKGIKPFGRPKGSRNKVSSEVREKFQQLVDSYSLEQMKYDLMELESGERLKIMSGLLDFFIPKLNRTDHNLTNGNEIITIQLPALPPSIPPEGVDDCDSEKML